MRLKCIQSLLAVCLVLGFSVEARCSGDIHTFTGPNGTTLEAEVIDFADGKVKIRRLSDQAPFELQANRLAPADVDFMRSWLKEREASAHPLGWKRVRIHLPHFADELDAPGIPAAFRRTDLHTWEAELPEGAWILVTIYREGGEKFAPQFLLPYDGEREWFLSFENARLLRAAEPQGMPSLVGLFVGSQDGEAELREIKAEIPAGGIALASEYLEPNDFSTLGKNVISAVVGEIDGFAVGADARLRALRMDETMREPAGLRGWDELEFLDVSCSGDWPLADCAELKGLTTLLVDGDVSLAAATKDGGFPALRHLSLREAGIDDADSFAGFVAQLGELNSLALPDDHALHLGGLESCPQLTALDLGNECGDPDAAGLSSLKNLTTLLLKASYRSAELMPLIEQGHFGKLRTLRAYQALPFASFAQLRELHLKGNEDEGMDLGKLALPARVTHLRLRNPNPADMAALGSVGDRISIQALTLTYPSLADLDSLVSLRSLAWLRIEDQLSTLDEKLVTLDTSALPALRGLSLLRLQNLTSLKPAGAQLQGLSVRSCSELTRVDPAADGILEKVILKR